jgi:hypothetical protein
MEPGGKHMKNRNFFLFLAFILIAALSASSLTEAVRYKQIENKFFYSQIDPNVVLIGPNDNDTLGMNNAYGFYLIDTKEPGRTLTVYTNKTLLAVKDNETKGIEFQWYVNQNYTTFLVKEESNITGGFLASNHTAKTNKTLITIHYEAQGGIIVIPPRPYKPPVIPSGEAAAITNGELSNIVWTVAGLSLIWIPCLFLVARRLKEHRVERPLSFARHGYNPGTLNSARGK